MAAIDCGPSQTIQASMTNLGNANMLEVCVDSVSAAVAARAAGAGRIELCSALDVGGVTPCHALIQSARKRIDCHLIVLIRPRTGDFVYDDSEREQALESIRVAIGCGADGVAVGGLTSSARLDLPFLLAMRQVAGEAQLAMHRAFDFVDEPHLAIDQLIHLGFDRVLTSGGPSGHVRNHLDSLRQWIEQAGQRLVIMPGGGISAQNAEEVLRTTGCRQLHGSFRLPSTHLGSEPLGTHRMPDAIAISQVAEQLRRAMH